MVTYRCSSYANSCVDLGKKLPLGLQLAHWKIYSVDYDDPENSDYMEKVEIDEETGTLLTPEYPPIGDSWYDPFQSVGLLTTLPSMAGSIYSGVQNLYQSVVVNVQLGHQLDYKVDTADSDSGFIIPFDLVNLNRISIVKGCDLVSSSFFVVCEYFKFDRVHYKSWKKWVKVVLQIIVVIIVIIIVCVPWLFLGCTKRCPIRCIYGCNQSLEFIIVYNTYGCSVGCPLGCNHFLAF